MPEPHVPSSVVDNNVWDRERNAISVTDVDGQVVTPVAVLQDMYTELKMIHRLLEILTETEVTPSDVGY